MERMVWEHMRMVQRLAVATTLLWTSLGDAASLMPSARSTSVVHGALAGSLVFVERAVVLQTSSTFGGGTPKEEIWKMGREMCEKRPDHPKCGMFKDEHTPTATPAPVSSATTTLTAAFVTTTTLVTTITPSPPPATTTELEADTTTMPAPPAPTEGPTSAMLSTQKPSLTTFGKEEVVAEESDSRAGDAADVRNGRRGTSDVNSGIWSGTFGDLVRWGQGTNELRLLQT